MFFNMVAMVESGNVVMSVKDGLKSEDDWPNWLVSDRG